MIVEVEKAYEHVLEESEWLLSGSMRLMEVSDDSFGSGFKGLGLYLVFYF